MKRRPRSLEIFSLSFLDVVSCGFGAVVLLVLISNNSENVGKSLFEKTNQLLEQVLAAEEAVASLSGQLSQAETDLRVEEAAGQRLGNIEAEITRLLGQKKQAAESLKADLEGLELVKQSLKRSSITPDTAKRRDDEVGGIPVDSDYVVFIVDTSGSMKGIWRQVTRELVNVLTIHPKVRGFQIINDNGAHLISGYAGRWIPDTPSKRQSVMKLFGIWNSASNSSPVEGLEVALKSYARPNIKMSVYIFGDDYTGASYEPVLRTVARLNKNRINGRPMAKIHGIGFLSGRTTNRFPILMREVAKQSGGTFLALPRN